VASDRSTTTPGPTRKPFSSRLTLAVGQAPGGFGVDLVAFFGCHEGGKSPGFLDGVAYDGRKPNDYLRSLAIGLKD